MYAGRNAPSESAPTLNPAARRAFSPPPSPLPLYLGTEGRADKNHFTFYSYKVMTDQDFLAYLSTRLSALKPENSGHQYGIGASFKSQEDEAIAKVCTYFAAAIYNKALRARDKYKFPVFGWATPDWEQGMQQQMAEHVLKGDPRDTGWLSAIAWFHGWPTATQLTAALALEDHVGVSASRPEAFVFSTNEISERLSEIVQKGKGVFLSADAAKKVSEALQARLTAPALPATVGAMPAAQQPLVKTAYKCIVCLGLELPERVHEDASKHLCAALESLCQQVDAATNVSAPLLVEEGGAGLLSLPASISPKNRHIIYNSLMRKAAVQEEHRDLLVRLGYPESEALALAENCETITTLKYHGPELGTPGFISVEGMIERVNKKPLRAREYQAHVDDCLAALDCTASASPTTKKGQGDE